MSVITLHEISTFFFIQPFCVRADAREFACCVWHVLSLSFSDRNDGEEEEGSGKKGKEKKNFATDFYAICLRSKVREKHDENVKRKLFIRLLLLLFVSTIDAQESGGEFVFEDEFTNG